MTDVTCDYLDCRNPAAWTLTVDGHDLDLCGGHHVELLETMSDLGTWRPLEVRS